MKREIKFRVWNTESKDWYTPTHNASKGELFELFVGMSGDLFAHVMDGMEHQSIWPENKYILMQYIGLKDKNGKEIYEGDIVEEKQVRKEYRIIAIKWSESNLGFYFYNSGVQFIEIIGNIYQNPELLS